MGYQRRQLGEHHLEPNSALGDQLLPIDPVAIQLVPDLLVKLLGGRIEKLEFKQVPQVVHFVPEHLFGFRVFAFSRLDQGQLNNGLVNEEVNDGVAVITGNRVLFQGDTIDGFRTLVVAGDDALVNHNVE